MSTYPPPLSPSSTAGDGRAGARSGIAAAQRYLSRYPAPPGPDFADACRDLELALRELADDDPLRVDASYMLGAIRATDHEMRCAQPCPAPDELAPIIALLAAGGGTEDGARPAQLYPYAMIVDKLYEHTHDPADIDLAITWLGRAAAHRRMPPADRRRVRIALGAQFSNSGAVARETERRAGPGTRSWAAFAAAIGQFEEVLSELGSRGRRSDTTRNEDKLDAVLGLLETYYQRGGEHLSDDDLRVMAPLARELIAAMTTDYRLRSYALGRSGSALIQRVVRDLGDPWEQALNTALLSQGPAAIQAAFTRVAGLDADLDAAIGALEAAYGLDETSSRKALFAAGSCIARAMRYLAHGGGEDLREFGRLCRFIMGSPDTSPYYKRVCGESLLVVLAAQVRKTSSGLAALSPPPHYPLRDTPTSIRCSACSHDSPRPMAWHSTETCPGR